MDRFVCAVIGLESKTSWCDDSFCFEWNDVVVDGHGTTRITGMTSLSKLFLLLIHQLSVSPCLPSRINQHSRDNLVPFVLNNILTHLLSTGHLAPIFDPSEIAEIARSASETCIDTMPNDLGLFDTLTWMLRYAYLVVSEMEDEGPVDSALRLTDPECDVQSPQFAQFKKLLDPKLAELRTQFDPDLFEEAERISLWKEFLQEVASGEECVNDTSFLKLSFFRPTLLSIQAKFQQVATSNDESAGRSTSSIDSPHSSPHTSLEAHHNASLQTIPSSPHFQQESLRLLTIIHSLLTSPIRTSLPKQTPTDCIEPKQTPIDSYTHMLSLGHIDDLDPTERFDSSMFDEEDDEVLAQSLFRCRSVCNLVGPDKCIDNALAFIDRTISVLGSSNPLLRLSALTAFSGLDEMPCVVSQLPRLWNRLRSAFHDGWPEEQYALIRMSTVWIIHSSLDASLQRFPLTQFDWDGLNSASFTESHPFLASIHLLWLIRRFPIDNEIDQAKAIQIILSFEQHQHAFSRIVSILDDEPQCLDNLLNSISLLSFCLLISLRSARDFPITLTTFLTTHPDFDCRSILFNFENIFLVLCHTSLNPHKPHQPPLDLIFERILRTHPDHFFAMGDGKDAVLPNTLVNTSLCGFHALCRRGVHFSLMKSELVGDEQSLLNSVWMLSTPLISDTFQLFLYYPPPLVVRFFLPFLWLDSDCRFMVDRLKTMMTTLLVVTAPFGDCLSLKELFRSVLLQNDQKYLNTSESDIVTRCVSIEWLNIPTGFGSAIVHSNPRVSFDPLEHQNQPHISLDGSFPLSQVPNVMFQYLSQQMKNVRHAIFHNVSLVHNVTRTILLFPQKRALIHLGWQPRGAVDNDDGVNTTCTREFVGVPVGESEPQSFNSQCASSIERGADTTERSGIENEEVLACTVVVFVSERPWIAKQ
ncbi:hypothetical protein BLNAU_7187 [Blattamonas nauphoetae]|uniref:Uncharacterized protein n=1 Tax=Blattamonas nauphoetae TaxID=2049346 RepID=A0ABQ9Y1Y5_9EUKA|nr:hypothetical protein BLNAU_7187 [Blattamonas nauphoetae]